MKKMFSNYDYMTVPIFGNEEIRSLVNDKALCTAMVKVELALSKVQSDVGLIPSYVGETLAKQLEGIEVETSKLHAGVMRSGVPVPALIGQLRKHLDPNISDWLHYGVTSQDIVDTAYNLCFNAALKSIELRLTEIIDQLEVLSGQFAHTLMLARTRGQLATPTTFGLRIAQWAQPLIALDAEVCFVRKAALRIQLGGSSGSRSAFRGQGGKVSKALAAELNLEYCEPWHTDRSGIRRLAHWLSSTITALAKIGRDFSIASRGEIQELNLKGGGASSTMPHKSNPVRAEALQSLIPVAVGCEAALAASAAHAEERDGALWPVEWVIMPTLLETTGAALNHCNDLLGQMSACPAVMSERVEVNPEAKSEAIVFALADEIGREKASLAVSEQLLSGRTIDELATSYPSLDLKATTADSVFVKPAKEVAQNIFAKRKTKRSN